MARIEFTEELKNEYNRLFSLAEIRPEHDFEVNAVARRILNPANHERYAKVQQATGVPSFVVGIIHSLEASFNFDAHLHNGDPLSGPTTHVPAGRPPGNRRFEWFESAIDALKLKNLHQWSDWSVAGIAYVLESYNGFGYRLFHPHVKSSYLWSFTTIYTSGRYVRDGVWSDVAVSKQCGGMAVLKRMIETNKVNLDAPPAEADGIDVAVTPFPDDNTGGRPSIAPPPFPGRSLQRNSLGPAVENVQTRLRELGIDPGGVDGDFGEQTETAVRLFQARSVDESGNPLEIDGIVGQKTWEALFGTAAGPARHAEPVDGTLTAEVLKVAADEVGVRERPLGSNRGPQVDQYLDSVASGLRGEPWCMAFIFWCFGKAAATLNVPNPAPKTAGVKRSWQRARSMPGVETVTAAEARQEPSKVVPGMVFYIDTGGTTGHAGFVADVVGGTLVTIEGNTNDGGGREGIGVFHRSKRKIRDIDIGFALFT